MNTKSLIRWSIALFCAVLMACSPFQPAPTPTPLANQLVTKTRPADATATVESVISRFGLAMTLKDTSYAPNKFLSDQLYVDIISTTMIYSATPTGYVTVSFEKLRPGQQIELLIDYGLGIRTSFPAKVYAQEILILK